MTVGKQLRFLPQVNHTRNHFLRDKKSISSRIDDSWNFFECGAQGKEIIRKFAQITQKCEWKSLFDWLTENFTSVVQ